MHTKRPLRIDATINAKRSCWVYQKLKRRWLKARRAPNCSRFDTSKSGDRWIAKERRGCILNAALSTTGASKLTLLALRGWWEIVSSNLVLATYRSLCDSPIASGCARRHHALANLRAKWSKSRRPSSSSWAQFFRGKSFLVVIIVN